MIVITACRTNSGSLILHMQLSILCLHWSV